jgi:hypothetical protein
VVGARQFGGLWPGCWPAIGNESSLESSDTRAVDPSGWAGVVSFPACLLNRRFEYRRINDGWRAHLLNDRHELWLDSGNQTIESRHRSFLLDVQEDRRERWATALAAIVAGVLGHFVDRTDEDRSTGQYHVAMTASPALGPNGDVVGVLCVRYDLTDARQSAANAAQLIDVLEAARKLQHFLGNQLALTLGYVELMTIDPRLPYDLRERVDEALRGVVEATETLTKLRQVTRLEIPPDDPSIADDHL